MQESIDIPHFSEQHEELLVQFDESWNHPEIETLRARCPSDASEAYVLELIRIDIHKRKEHRLATDQERYLTTFPELRKQETLRQSIAQLLDDSHSQRSSQTLPSFPMKRMNPSESQAPQPEDNKEIHDRYRFLTKLGEVWIARQEEPVRRTVAVKLMKLGMDSDAMLLRFEQERQALARMDHVNINKVLDAGVMRDGRPFFVMEYVEGQHLLAFCETAKLSLRDRLKLFISICHGVQHAHQKGIVHRDLKPANILVIVSDNKPVPKIIDFGEAKANTELIMISHP